MIQRLKVRLTQSIVVMLLATVHAVAADLRIGISAEPSSLDPHFHNLASNNNLSAHVFEALTRFDSDSKLVPRSRNPGASSTIRPGSSG